ncbi:ras-related c3 botulinum toxin substrate 1 [Anaeramoeba ignava]|uniref:Ras-related c3 botulinum toxin substrate 1 n=1 Tax=Anaeramoeba ignava TaxID=1746090 RepID=A0A9Q0LQ05_ANAIG|nr:ras-related c3 botulinum toxin substrate 1 [Anaeramoeba ignava]
MQKYKILFVGDRGVGKSTALFVYDHNKFPELYIPTVYDNFEKKFQIEDKETILQIWDTLRTEDLDRLFPLYYLATYLIAIFFSIDSNNSFERVESFWIPDIEKHAPKNSKIILIGTKIDLRNESKEENKKLITKEEGIKLAKKIKAIKYFECSSLNQKGIETIFNEIALICFGKYKEINQEKENKKGLLFIGTAGTGKTSLLLTYNEKKLPEIYIPTVLEYFEKNFKFESGNKLENKLENQNQNKLENKLENELENQLENQLENELENQNQNQNKLENQNQNKLENQMKELKINFWDSARNPDYDRLFPLYYINSNVIAICFAIDDYESFEKIPTFWIPEIEKYVPKSKIILIGTKIDLRNNEERINELKEGNKKLITKEEGIEMAKKIKAIKYFECSSLNQKGIETIFNEIALICFEIDQEINQEKEKKKRCILN